MKTLRKNILQKAKKVVIKIGTNVLTSKSGLIDRQKISQLVDQAACLAKDHKRKIILVSSGAIGAGMDKLGIKKRPSSLPDIQALAAVGQSILVEAYRNEFNRLNIEIGQILVTREDFQNHSRYLNISNTLAALLDRNIIPVFNENDTVSTREITFGDNDQLCTLVSHAVQADLSVILTSTDGLLDLETGKRIDYVENIDKNILSLVSDSKSSRGAGGMRSKIEAVRQIVNSGVPVIMADGNSRNILSRIFDGEETGTFFRPGSEKMKSRKRWIAYSAKPSGELTVDDGAAAALLRNSSLLAIGVRDVTGNFHRGATVRIMNKNREIARGLVNYDASGLQKIKGLKSSEFSGLPEGEIYEEVIHRDNLAITAGDTEVS